MRHCRIPMWVVIKYRVPASRTSGFSSSVTSVKYAESAMTSQARRNSMPSRANTTMLSDAASVPV
jgi:hypothetical protein